MPTIVFFSIDLAGHSHSIRCEVTAIEGGHTVAYLDAAHVADLVDTHKLNSAALDVFEAKAIEAFELKARAAKVLPLEDIKEAG